MTDDFSLEAALVASTGAGSSSASGELPFVGFGIGNTTSTASIASFGTEFSFASKASPLAILAATALAFDAKTIRFRYTVLKKGGIWKDIYGTDQKQVSDMVREDQVDILVELTGHTANNKLGMMACRLALDAKSIRFRDKVLKKGRIWKDIYGTDQNQATDMVREDQDDILVELTGHTANNKMGMMACRLALETERIV